MTTIVLHNRKLGSESIVRCSCKALAVFDLKRKCAGCLGSRIKVKYVDLIAELDNHKYTLTGLALNFITYGYTNEPEDRLRSLEELAQTDHLELNSSAFYESGSGVIRSDIDLVVAIPSKATHIAFHCSDNEDASQLLHVVTILFRSKVGLRQVCVYNVEPLSEQDLQ